MGATTEQYYHRFLPIALFGGRGPTWEKAGRLTPRAKGTGEWVEVYPVAFGEIQWMSPECWDDEVVKHRMMRMYGCSIGIQLPREAFGYLILRTVQFQQPSREERVSDQHESRRNFVAMRRRVQTSSDLHRSRVVGT